MNRLRWLFAGAVFLGSFLLFLVEPIAAKQLLPILGGSAAVWITCLVYFQSALLLAYLYAHWLARSSRWAVQLAVLIAAAGAALGWAFGNWSPNLGSDSPMLAVFASLTVWIGLPFLVLGATSPLLQVWWARTQKSAIPYKLFALSNLASLAALALYPAVIEPQLTLRAQRVGWAVAFCLFVLLAAAITLNARSSAPQRAAVEEDANAPRAGWRDQLLWILLPMGAAMQLSAITSYLTANVAAIPLLWVLPLGVYLVTIILAFEFPRLAQRAVVARLLLVLLAGLAYMLTQTESTLPIRISIVFFLAELFFAGFFLHSEAYALRPKRSSESTVFYLAFAAGGALGSFLIGIVAPSLFRYNYDLAICFLVTALLAATMRWRDGWSVRLTWVVSSATMVVLVCWLMIASERQTVAATRNFYGALRVKQNLGYPGATMRTLTNGSIQHGTQIFGTDQQRHMPTTYYAEDSGVGLALKYCCNGQGRNVGVIGLGAGTLAAYGQPGDEFRFYEINPAVEPIAREVFTYIRESGARIRIADGDGRVSLEREVPRSFDVLVVDAFSGDAIPLHLLTAEAMKVYRRHMKPGGILAFHISNQHVDLEPAIALLAQSSGMTAMRFTTPANEDRGEFAASWVLVTDHAAFFQQPGVVGHGHPAVTRPGLRLWTDDYSSLLPVLYW
ncbi:MAG TPA: fused MFS/spermidine synthase [Terracidiphilus sp.]|nr:fused MFS/spermidine synthase [Terracidiphilus sp.]